MTSVFQTCCRFACCTHVFESAQLWRLSDASCSCTGNRGCPICRYDDTIIYFQRMQKAGLKGDAYTLTALLTACERVGKWEEAVQLDADFRAAGVATNLRHQNCLISVFSTAEQWQLVSQNHHQCSWFRLIDSCHLCCWCWL